MRRVMALVLVLLCVGVGLASDGKGRKDALRSSGEKILEFDTMVGVSDPFLGSINAVLDRLVRGAPLPWVISRVEGEVKTNGKVEIDVFGLVLADDPRVPANQRLHTPPNFNFRALVSCVTKDNTGKAVVANVSTGNFPASPLGDAIIEAEVDLPSPCIAPVVFITTTGGSWLAVTGH